jgi:hypothetical protein
MRPFVNEETLHVFLAVVTDWENPAEIARQWLDIGSGSAADLLAARLKEDYWQEYGRVSCDDALFLVFAKKGLRRICWHQVAERLLECYGRRKEQAAAEDAREDAADGEGGGTCV